MMNLKGKYFWELILFKYLYCVSIVCVMYFCCFGNLLEKKLLNKSFLFL